MKYPNKTALVAMCCTVCCLTSQMVAQESFHATGYPAFAAPNGDLVTAPEKLVLSAVPDAPRPSIGVASGNVQEMGNWSKNQDGEQAQNQSAFSVDEANHEKSYPLVMNQSSHPVTPASNGKMFGAMTMPTQDPQIGPSQVQDRFQALSGKRIADISLDIRDSNAKIPADRSEQLVHANAEDWYSMPTNQKVFAWTAPDIRYQPLYFENVKLERYGQTPGEFREFFLSGLHFFNSAMLLPLHMYETPPKSCDYPLGFCRPGNINPYITDKFWYGRPLRLRK